MSPNNNNNSNNTANSNQASKSPSHHPLHTLYHPHNSQQQQQQQQQHPYKNFAEGIRWQDEERRIKGYLICTVGLHNQQKKKWLETEIARLNPFLFLAFYHRGSQSGQCAIVTKFILRTKTESLIHGSSFIRYCGCQPLITQLSESQKTGNP